MKAKCVSIRDDQDDFLSDQKQSFNFSKFIQFKLDNYIKLRKENKEFLEVTK